MELIDIMEDAKVFSNVTNRNTKVDYMENVCENHFEIVTQKLVDEGYRKMEEGYMGAYHRYNGFLKDGEGVFVNYFKNTSSLTVVYEKDCRYFDFADNLGKILVKPQITQVHLEDFGMSYVVRLSDGRYIVIDGGREFEPDAQRLYECLKSGSPFEKPVIAAWIFTHPHSDHFHCFIKFYDMYNTMVDIERFLYYFPERDDEIHYPRIKVKDARFEDSSPYTNIALMEERVAKTGAKVYTPHTGQKYVIGDASLKFLCCMDDTIHRNNDINSICPMIRMELAGQVVLWGADVCCEAAELAPRYGEYLKADILQIPHHGFQCGSAQAEIDAYNFITPDVCFLPSSEYNAFTVFGLHKESTRYLMEHMDIGEIICGDINRTITLPYVSSVSGRSHIKSRLHDGISASGAKAWVYMGLSTAQKEDLEFTFLNTTHKGAKVRVEFFFEDNSRNLRYITINLGACSMKTINIIGDEADDDTLFFNWMSMKERGFPESAEFGVRFLSDIPIVVKHKIHKEVYHA